MISARPFMHLAWLAAIAGVLFAAWMATFAALFGIAPSAPRARQLNPINGPIHTLTER